MATYQYDTWLTDLASEAQIGGPQNIRFDIPASFFAGDTVRIRLTAGSKDLYIQGASIGELDYTQPYPPTSPNFQVAPTRLTFGGYPYVLIPANKSAYSDPVTYAYNNMTSHVVHLFLPQGNNTTNQYITAKIQSPALGVYAYRLFTPDLTDYTMVQTVTGWEAINTLVALDRIQITSSYNNYYGRVDGGVDIGGGVIIIYNWRDYVEPVQGGVDIGGTVIIYGSSLPLRNGMYTSNRFKFRPTRFGAIKVLSGVYPITVTIAYPNLGSSQTVIITSENPQRLALPATLVDCMEVSVTFANELTAIFIATTMAELPL